MACRNKKLILLIAFSLFLSTVSAISLYPPMQLDDPFSSEKLLSQRTFLRELDPSDQAAADQLTISLTTMGKGDPLYVWFGHSGLVVTDQRSGRSVMYDYGIFSFDDDFYQTFALGRLNYEVWATSAPARYEMAIEEDRTITSITLNLPDSGKLELVRFLNFNIEPQQNTYLYHHYTENCSTRIRDIIDRAVGGQFKSWAQSIPYEETLRQMVMRHTAASPFIDWTLNFLQSGTIDSPITVWEAMFLPAVLEEALLAFSYVDSSGNRIPLVTQRETLHTATEDLRTPVLEQYQSMTLHGTLFGIAIGLISILLGRVLPNSRYSMLQKFGIMVHGWFAFLWTFILGVLALLLVFMMVGSNHDVTYFNENSIFVNPYLLILSVQALRSAFGKERSLRRFRQGNTFMAILVLVTILLKGVFHEYMIQQNWQILFTVLPCYIANSSIPFERLFQRRRFLSDED